VAAWRSGWRAAMQVELLWNPRLRRLVGTGSHGGVRLPHNAQLKRLASAASVLIQATRTMRTRRLAISTVVRGRHPTALSTRQRRRRVGTDLLVTDLKLLLPRATWKGD